MKQLSLSIALLPVFFSSCDKHQVFPSEAKIEGITSIISTQNNMANISLDAEFQNLIARLESQRDKSKDLLLAESLHDQGLIQPGKEDQFAQALGFSSYSQYQ